ncbi:MAG TPA: MlaD family protein [Vitreimonas sp.]|uniref:MlaD family protein n=1 Tax=Vitreimonas sp. TaxID=3069702 RepID=UPI002D22F400|nr:MlaD family protein [Vitreimonas sp.]HYD88730.1 MlaD family protein [Vitreimonas sp.]
METKANYVLIGAATVIGAVLIMLFAMWITGGQFNRGYNVYDVVFDDPVRGLTEGGEVRFNGIKVGEVDTLRIDPDNTNRVIARIRVSSDVPVKTDSEAQLEPIGLTGVTLIQLSPGSAEAQLLRAGFGGPPPRIPGRGSQIDILVERSEDIALRASEAMAAVRDLLTDENIARVTRIVENLEEVSQRLAAQDSVINESGAAAREVTVLARQMQRDLAELDQVIGEINDAAGVASGETLPELTLAAEEIRRAASSINRVATNLEENPSLLTPRAPRPTVELEP